MVNWRGKENPDAAGVGLKYRTSGVFQVGRNPRDHGTRDRVASGGSRPVQNHGRNPPWRGKDARAALAAVPGATRLVQ
jgi:hypothetical protein